MQYLENGRPVTSENSNESGAQYLQLAEGAVAGVAALLDSVDCDLGKSPDLEACFANLQSLSEHIKNLKKRAHAAEMGVSQEIGCLKVAGLTFGMLEEHCPEGQTVPFFSAHLIRNALELRNHIQQQLEG
jgi:hypothetical protein